MTAFPKYPKYKASGVEWLGDVPEHWEIRRNLSIFDERKEANLPNAELLSVTQDRGIIRQSEITAKKDSSNDDKTKYKVVKVGDLAYNKMRAWQGALGISDYDGIVSPAYVVLTPRNPKLSKFFHYLFRTNEFITEANRLSYGLCGDMNSLRYEHFKTSYSVIPPDQDIDRIVAFLDEKTAEIDTLIAKKQRQIELLDEQKAILINRAVTRGLHPHAELQDSGIEWIGHIPKHWNTKRVKHVCRNIATGGTPRDVRHRDDCSDGLTWYTPGDFKVDGVLQGSERVALPKRGENVEVYPPHSIYFIGIGGTIGTINRSLVAGSCNQQINVLAIDDSANSAAYFAFLLQSAKMFIVNTSDYTTLPIINRSKTASIAVVQPPRQEQVEIAAHCEMISLQTSKAKALIESQIQTLQTLRSTLIAHAVTGKIAVPAATV